MKLWLRMCLVACFLSFPVLAEESDAPAIPPGMELLLGGAAAGAGLTDPGKHDLNPVKPGTEEPLPSMRPTVESPEKQEAVIRAIQEAIARVEEACGPRSQVN